MIEDVRISAETIIYVFFMHLDGKKTTKRKQWSYFDSGLNHR